MSNETNFQESIFNSIGDAIIVANKSGEITQINPMAENLIGLSAIDAEGKPLEAVFNVLNTLTGEEYKDLTQQVINSGMVTWQSLNTKLITYSKKEYLITGSANTIKDSKGTIEGVVISFREVVGLNQTEKLVSDARAQFKNLFNLSPIPTIFTSLPERIFIDINNATEALLGYNREDLIGHSTLEFDIFAVKEEREEIIRHLSDKGSVKGVEAQILTNRGETITCTLYIEILNQQGRTYSITQLVDVTEHRKIKKELVEKDILFHALVEKSSEAITVVNEKGNAVYASPTAIAMLGYTAEELNKMRFSDILHPDDIQIVEKIFVEVMQVPGKEVKLLGRQRQKSGEYIWCEGVATNWFHDPVINGIVVNFRDVTERKLSEKIKHESETRFTTLFKLNPSPVGITRASNYSIVDVNEAWCKMTGYASNEAIGRTTTELKLTHTNTLAQIRGELQKHNKVNPLEISILTRYGKERRVVMSSELIELNGEDFFINTFLDITELKQAERESNEVRQLFQFLFNFSPVAYSLGCLSDRRIVDVNSAWETLFGYSKEEVVGKLATDFDFWQNTDERDAAYKKLNEDGRLLNYGVNILTKSGDKRSTSMYTEILEQSGVKYIFSVFIDITEREKNEETIRISLIKYKTLFENFPAGITVSDKTGNIIETNTTAEKILGISAEEQAQRQLNGEEWQIVRTDGTLMPAEEYASVRALYEKKKVENVEMGIVKPDKTITWINVTAAPIPLEDYGVVVTYNDITTRKQAEAKVLETQENYKNIFDNNPLPMWVYDIETLYFLEVNEAAIAKYGYSRNEFLKMTILDIRPKEDYERLIENVASVTEGIDEAGDWRHIKKNGSLIDVEITTHTLTYFGRKAELVLANDVTERKQSQEKLRQSQLLLRQVLDSEPDAIFAVDLNYNLLINNKRHQQVLVETGGRKLNVGESILPSDYLPEVLEYWRGLYGRAFSGEEFKLEMEWPYTDGQLHTIECSFSPLRDIYDKIMGALVVIHDITERKQKEDTLKKLEYLLSEGQKIAHMGTFEYIVETQTTYWSAEEYSIYGLNPDEPSPSYEVMLEKCIYPEDAVLLNQTFATALQNNSLYDLEHRILRPDGSVRWVHDRAHPYFDQNGKLVRYVGITLDITEQKQTESKLRQEKEKLDRIAASVPGVICSYHHSITGQASMPYASAAIKDVLGLDPEDVVDDMTPIFSKIPTEDIGHVVSSIEYSAKTMSVWRDEYRYQHPKKGLIWIEGRSLPVKNSDGSLTWHGFIADITERKKVEVEIREGLEREQFLGNLVRNASVAVGVGYPDGRLGMCNLAFQKLTGYNEEELMSIAWNTVLTPPEWLEKEMVFLTDLERTKQPITYEKEYIHKNGKRVPIELVVHPFYNPDGGVSHYYAFITDITERKQARTALEDNEKRLRKTLETTSDGFWIVDSNRKFLEVNEAYCKMTGYAREELMNMSISDLEALETKEDTNVRIQKIISEGRDRFDTVHRRKDGSFFDVEVSVNVLDHEQGLMICFCRDITERKIIEKQIRESEKRFSTIFEDSPVAIAISRLNDGKIILVNESAINLFGFPLEEFIGKTTIDLGIWTRPDDRQRFMELIRINQRVEEMETDLRIKSGEKRKVLVWGELLELSGEPCVMVEIIDITERKRAEQQLLERDAELINAQELAKMAAWRVDLADNQLSVSENYRRLIEVDDENIEINFDFFISHIHPVDADLMNPKKYNLSPESSPVVFDFRMILPDNSIKWFQNTMVGEFSEGNLIALKGTYIDITEKKNREEEIRSQNEKLNAILNSLPDKLFVHDSEGNFLEAYTTNPDGYIVPVNHFIGKNLSDIFPSDVAELNLKYLKECLEKKALVRHEFSTDYKGNLATFEVRVVPFMEDKVIRFVRDITKNKEYERQIVKLNKAIEQSPVAIVVTDLDANISYASHAFEEITGYTKDEVMGKNTRILKSGKNKETLYVEMWQTIKSGDLWEGELINKKKDGEFYWEHLSITPLYENSDKITGYLAVKQDITEKKKNEQEILELNVSLEQKVEKRTAQLKEANELLKREIQERKVIEEALEVARHDAEKANVAKSEFLSRMSHELRTPLNSILGFAQLLEMGELNPNQQKGVTHIMRSGKHLLDLINEVLDISRIEAGRISLSPEPVQLHSVISETLDIVKPLANDRKISVELNNSQTCNLFIKADRQRVKQVLINLINNGIKYNNEGGYVRIECKQHYNESTSSHSIRILVNDNGYGISDENISNLFKPFERIGAEKTTIEGTGLGLAVAKKLIEAMGGTLGVESKLNEGSTFWIEFPKCESQFELVSNHEKFDTEDLSSSTKNGTILYVEDNIPNIELIEQVLDAKFKSIKLVTTRFGKEAVKLAIEQKPNLILLDLNLPDTHGSDVFEELKGNFQTMGIPVVVISADALPNQLNRLLNAGVKQYLTKPLDISEFLKVVNKYVDI